MSVYPSIKGMLEWSQNEDKPLEKTELAKKARESMGPDASNLEHIDQQLYFMLISLTDGTTNNLVANSNLGFEAWRKLSKTYDPTGGGRIWNLLKQIINPGKCKVENLKPSLEMWEQQVTKYESTKDPEGNKRTMTEDMKMAALTSMLPVELENHLQLNSTR